MEGDVAEKDNVLLTLCCSKNSYNQENGGRWEGGGGYLQDRLRSTLFSAPCGCLASATIWIWDLRVEDEIQDEHEGQSSWQKDSEWKKGQKLGGVSGQPHWSVLAFFGPVALLQKQRAESESALFIGQHAGGGGVNVHLRVRRGAWSFGSRFCRGSIFAGLYSVDGTFGVNELF